ncbi:MAG TPA: copper transporter [Acidimicrobiales bacterium]|nr:copper transporter [Acidimicrobiales bacterium]
MINFRFHLVSLTGIFLALGIGIAVGATVVDRATVDALQSRLDGVERRVNATDKENAGLQSDLRRWAAFADQAGDAAVAGRLEGVPVLVIGIAGTDRGPVDALRQDLGVAGARLEGTAWFTSKFKLEKPEDISQLAGIVGVTPRGAISVRRNALSRVAADLAADQPSGVLAALRDAAFVDFEEPAGAPVDLAAVPAAGSRFVVASGPGSEVADGDLAIPFAQQLSHAARARVLAVESGRERRGKVAASRGVFVGPLRADEALAGLLSTIDDLEDFKGRFAAIYALRDLGDGKVGHFGVGPGATRLVPETA